MPELEEKVQPLTEDDGAATEHDQEDLESPDLDDEAGDEEPTEETETPEPSDDDGPEFYDSEEDYLKELGAPENIKSVQDLLKSQQEAVRKMNELMRAQSEQKDPTETNQAAESGGFKGIQLTPTTEYVESMIKSGQIDDKNAATWRSIGKVADESFKHNFDVINRVMTGMANHINRINSTVMNGEFHRFKSRHKDVAIDKGVLDEVMRKYPNVNDYQTAYRVYAAAEDPSLFHKMAEAQKPKDKPKQMRFASRRGKATAPPKHEFAKFVDSSGNIKQKQVDSLPTGKRKDFYDWFTKTFKPRD